MPIKQAEGRPAPIPAVAEATAAGIRSVAESIQAPGGYEAVQYRVATDYIGQFGNLAKETNTLILPSNFADVAGMIAAAMTVIKHRHGRRGPPPSTPRPPPPAPGGAATPNGS